MEGFQLLPKMLLDGGFQAQIPPSRTPESRKQGTNSIIATFWRVFGRTTKRGQVRNQSSKYFYLILAVMFLLLTNDFPHKNPTIKTQYWYSIIIVIQSFRTKNSIQIVGNPPPIYFTFYAISRCILGRLFFCCFKNVKEGESNEIKTQIISNMAQPFIQSLKQF